MINKQTTYMILLIDRKKAVMFTLIEGMAVGKTKVVSFNDVPQRVRVNEERFYGRSDKIFRHIEDHLHRHLLRVSDVVREFAEGEDISGVFLGGHDEIFKKINTHLPVEIGRIVKGTFVAELNIPFNEILRKAKQAVKEFEQDTSFMFVGK